MERSTAALPELMHGDMLTLRRWTPADAEQLCALVAENIEHLRPFMRWIALEPVAVEQRRAMLLEREREWAAGGSVMHGVFMDGGAVGSCGFHRRIGPGALEIGYWIHHAYVRRGLGTECARVLTDAAFWLPAIDRVEIHHDKANEASRALAARLGFTFVGERPDTRDAPGKLGIECIWRMHRAEWSHVLSGRRSRDGGVEHAERACSS